MPHTWDMVSRLFEPETSGADADVMWLAVAKYAWYTRPQTGESQADQ